MRDHRNPRLTIASIAVDVPMGAQNYQTEITQRASAALAVVDDRDWHVRQAVVRSLRSPLAGNKRIPLHAVTTAPPLARRETGRWLYGRDALVHRMSLELPPAPAGNIITLHDVVAWRYPDESAPVRAAVAEVRAADAVICVSEFTAQEARDFLGVRNPIVVPNGVDPRYLDAEPLDPVALTGLGISGPFVLHAGGAAERKNLAELAAAWPAVRRERPELLLALAGPLHPRRTELFAGMPGVVLLGRVASEHMPGLVAAATGVIVPSLYEGFGLPVLEGMAANTLVIAAETSSLPEVAGGAAIMVQPTGESIADGIMTATSADPELKRLITAGRERAAAYSWERSAIGHARVWASLA